MNYLKRVDLLVLLLIAVIAVSFTPVKKNEVNITTCVGAIILNSHPSITLSSVNIYPDDGINNFFLGPINPGEVADFKILEGNDCALIQFNFSSNPSGGTIKIKLGTTVVNCYSLSNISSIVIDWCSFICDQIYTIEFSANPC